MEDIKVSVVVTVYNSGDFLDKCLLSLIQQDLKEIEIVVVNDGSPDPQDDLIIQRYLKQDGRFVYVNNINNVGTGGAREIGVAASKGEYIGFLDSDDFAMPNAYRVLYSRAVETRSEISVGDYLNTRDRHVAIEKWNDESAYVEVLSGERMFESQIKRYKKPYYLRVDWWNKIYKRSLFQEHGVCFPKVVRNEGTMSMIMSILANKCAIVDIPLFYSYNRPDSVCRVFRYKNISDTISSTIFFKRWLERLGVYEKYKDDFINFFYFVIFNHNLKLLLKAPPEDRKRYLPEFISSLNDDSEIRLGFYRYLTLQERGLERLVFSSLNNKKTFSVLKQINLTDFHDRKEGGRRLALDRNRKKTKRPLVSIITIVKDLYSENRVSLFDQMRASVDMQTYGRDNIEHIVIDAASKDGTLEFLASLDQVDYWISECDSGVYNAMNKGPLLARGDYVLYLNSDDYLHQDAIRVLVDAIEGAGVDYVFGNADKVNFDNKKVGSHIGNINKVYFGVPYCHQTLLCKNSCFDKVRFDESFRITMWSFSLGLHLAGFESVYLNKTVAYFRVGGISTDKRFETRFKDEQTRIKRDDVVRNLNIDLGEYEYLNHIIRSWDVSAFSCDLFCILDKLSKGSSVFQVDFYNKLCGLLREKKIIR